MTDPIPKPSRVRPTTTSFTGNLPVITKKSPKSKWRMSYKLPVISVEIFRSDQPCVPCHHFYEMSFPNGDREITKSPTNPLKPLPVFIAHAPATDLHNFHRKKISFFRSEKRVKKSLQGHRRPGPGAKTEGTTIRFLRNLTGLYFAGSFRDNFTPFCKIT